MIAVEPTPQNWKVYDLLCELDAEYSVCDESRRADIIAKAIEICENELEEIQ